MKHWHPYVGEVFEEISKDGVTDLLAIALAPHYSRMSIGSYQESVKKANEEHGGKVNVINVNEWYLNPVFLEKWTQRITGALEHKFPGKQRKRCLLPLQRAFAPREDSDVGRSVQAPASGNSREASRKINARQKAVRVWVPERGSHFRTLARPRHSGQDQRIEGRRLEEHTGYADRVCV